MDNGKSIDGNQRLAGAPISGTDQEALKSRMRRILDDNTNPTESSTGDDSAIPKDDRVSMLRNFGDSLLERELPDSEDTVSDRASENFIKGIEKDIEEGKLSEDSQEAALLTLFRAKAASEEGYELHGYIEDRGAFPGTTYRESDVEPTLLTGLDVQEIIDPDKLDEKIAELMGSEEISERYEDSLQDAVDQLPDSETDAIKRVIEFSLFDPETGEANTDFEKSVIHLYENGGEDAKNRADAEVSKYFEALKILDPDRYIERHQTFNSIMVTHEIDQRISEAGLENSDLVSDDDKSSGLLSTLALVKGGLNSFINLAKHGNSVDDGFKKIFDDIKILEGATESMTPEQIARLNDGIREAASSESPNYDKIVNDALSDLKDNRNETSGAFKRFLSNASSKGMLGSMAGTLSLATAIESLVGGGDLTSDEQIAVARNLIGGLSVTKDFSTFGSNIVQTLGGKLPPDAEGNRAPRVQATDWLGIYDDNFGDIWNSDKPTDGLSEQIRARIDTASDEVVSRDIAPDASRDTNTRLGTDVADELGTVMGFDSQGDRGRKLARQVGQSFLRFMTGAGFDITGGVLDIVSGARKLQSANNDLERADAGITLGAGISTTTQGLLTTVGMLESRAASITSRALLNTSIGARGASSALSSAATAIRAVSTVARVGGPVLGALGAIFGIAGALISEAVQHNKMQKLTDSQGEFFKGLADLKVTHEDWGDKLEYARYATYMYGSRDAPEDVSLYDYQSLEWDFFAKTEQAGGSSLNRLAPYLHRDGDLGELNLYEKWRHGRTSTIGSRGITIKNDDWRPWNSTNLDEGNPYKDDAFNSLSVEEQYENSVLWNTGYNFRVENEDHIRTIVEHWDDWNGRDDIVSEKDLREYLEEDHRGEKEKAAIKFLLENDQFRHALDGVRTGGLLDRKISDKDLNKWLEMTKSDLRV